MTTLLAALAVGGGLASLVVAVLMRARERQTEIEAILDLPFGEKDVSVEGAHGVVPFFEPGVALAHKALERFRLMSRMTEQLTRARIPLRPGEFVLVSGGTAVIGSITVWLLTGQPMVGLITLFALLWGAWFIVKFKGGRRSKAFEAQLPEALALIASSLEAGHTFLHSISMMVEESEPPLSEEFERVIAETRLGDPLLDALQRMSERLQIPDLAWVVQAIRIQQTVGGKLADLLTTLAEFMRAREEIRREVQVLTAEGRLSAWVLGALPVFVFMVVKTLNPKYLDPMLHGKGLIALGIAAGSVVTGMAVIKRMAKIDV